MGVHWALTGDNLCIGFQKIFHLVDIAIETYMNLTGNGLLTKAWKKRYVPCLMIQS